MIGAHGRFRILYRLTYLAKTVRREVGRLLLMLTWTLPFFLVLRTTSSARPFHATKIVRVLYNTKLVSKITWL